MGNKISLSMYPRNFAFDKMVRETVCTSVSRTLVYSHIEAMFLFKFSPVTSYAQSQAQSTSLEITMASLVALVKCIQKFVLINFSSIKRTG